MNDATRESPGRALLHRWLVEFNPLYLLSAALVLAGTFLCSRGLAEGGSLYGTLAVAGIAELYALALVGGAAVLVRLGHVRPAVMLGLLTVLYQSDLTLHTETCANLGVAGTWAAAGWALLYAGKLFALARALRLRLSRTAVATALVAGAGLAIGPFVLHDLTPDARGGLVASWVFALASLQRTAVVASRVPLDAWGETVLRRSVRATWAISGALLAGHVLFWAADQRIAVVPFVPLLFVRSTRSERRVWVVLVATLVVAALVAPATFALVAAMAAAALLLRAFAPVFGPEIAATPAPRSTQPYRAGASEQEASVMVTPLVDTAEAHRLLAGALAAAWLSAWTLGWAGGALPPHVLALDLLLTFVAAFLAWRRHARPALAPSLAVWTHLVAAKGLLPTPRTSLEWGGAALLLGFALLLGSVAATWRLRRT